MPDFTTIDACVLSTMQEPRTHESGGGLAVRGCTQCVAAYRVWLNATWFTWNWSAFDLVHRGSPWFTVPFSPVLSRSPSARSYRKPNVSRGLRKA